mgnify:CR=1 FL=1
MEPHIIKALIKDGQVVEQLQPKKIRRVISERTAAVIRDMLVDVVASGTGNRAAIDGIDGIVLIDLTQCK